jgi:hypothetical protein
MTGRIVNNLIEVRQGDSFTINIAVKDKCGKPINLTGANVLMQVRDSGNNLIFSVTQTPVDVLKGKVALMITPTMTASPVGEYNTDIQLTLADGTVDTLYPRNVNDVATFRITPQVTTGA